jgi:hypothetical protein
MSNRDPFPAFRRIRNGAAPKAKPAKELKANPAGNQWDMGWKG